MPFWQGKIYCVKEGRERRPPWTRASLVAQKFTLREKPGPPRRSIHGATVAREVVCVPRVRRYTPSSTDAVPTPAFRNPSVRLEPDLFRFGSPAATPTAPLAMPSTPLRVGDMPVRATLSARVTAPAPTATPVVVL